MPTTSNRSGSITAAAVVAIAGSLLAAFSFSITLLAHLFVPINPSLPTAARNLIIVMTVLMLCVALFGVATGIGLFLLRNWARVSAMIWGGVCVFFGIIGIPLALTLPFNQLPTTTSSPVLGTSFLRVVLLVSYGTPLGVGIWWLVLFNRKTIKEQFANDHKVGPAASSPKPRCPLPIAVVAWFFMLSVLNILVYPLLPFRVPLLLFGHLFYGKLALGLFALFGVLLFLAGIGLLRLRRWGYWLTLGLQLLFLANGAITAISPGLESMLSALTQQMYGAMQMNQGFLTSAEYVHLMREGVYFGVIFSVAVLVLLVYYRDRFFQAAAAKELGTASTAKL